MEIDTLIGKSKNGDTEAFGQIVTGFRDMVFRLAFRLLCDGEEAKDAVQDTFVKAWSSLKRYDPRYSFSTWLYRIATRVCYDRLRAAERRRTERRLPQEYGDTAANAEDRLINEELRNTILSLTEGLSPRQKLVFTLSDLEGLSAGEIRTMTGLSLSSIKSNLYLARKQIREKMTF
jgi:RNA polymerase sigma-70 factor (ECF subfamily)